MSALHRGCEGAVSLSLWGLSVGPDPGHKGGTAWGMSAPLVGLWGRVLRRCDTAGRRSLGVWALGLGL